MDTQHQGRDWSDKRIFTTGEAAEICKVSQQTIIRCFDSGRLTGFRVPGSKFRRIPREELLRFMRENSIPTDILEGDTRRVLVVDDDPNIVSLLNDMLSRDGRFEVQSAATGYDAGLLTESFRPHIILLDYMLPDINGNIVCQRIRTSPARKDTRILIISGVVRQEEVRGLLEAGADDFLKKPFSMRELIARLEKLLGLDPLDAGPVEPTEGCADGNAVLR
jgi:two-component system, OmpR family, response regulator